MIQVMIVEDEPPILWRCASLLEQVDPAFSVVATAMNGREALEKMREFNCDVVITDIQMPVMSGLELMDRIREQYPGCIVVVLSGYQDFEYVSHAIRAQSLDYLLKPISAESMRELLTRIREQYMKNSRERLRQSLSMHLNKSAAGVPRPDQDGGLMGLCLFCAGSFPAGDDAEMYPAADFWNTRSLEKLAQEAAPGFSSFIWEFMGNTQVERILIFQAADGQVGLLAKCLHEALLDQSRLPIHCVYNAERVTLAGTSGALLRLRELMASQVRIGRSLFLSTDEETPEPSFNDREEMSTLGKLLAAGQFGYTDPVARELFTRMEREQWTQRRILNLFTGAARILEHSGRESLQELSRQYQSAFPDAICTALSMNDLEVNLISLTEAGAPDARGGLFKQDAVITRIEQYLREHYPEHITNQVLAVEFGYVPSYISMLFRQKYKVSPSEYLTQLRMEQAKRLMEEHPEMLIREIAEQVGFKSQHHFSRLFKKMEGLRPTSYNATGGHR